MIMPNCYYCLFQIPATSQHPASLTTAACLRLVSSWVSPDSPRFWPWFAFQCNRASRQSPATPHGLPGTNLSAFCVSFLTGRCERMPRGSPRIVGGLRKSRERTKLARSEGCLIWFWWRPRLILFLDHWPRWAGRSDAVSCQNRVACVLFAPYLPEIWVLGFRLAFWSYLSETWHLTRDSHHHQLFRTRCRTSWFFNASITNPSFPE